MSGGTESGSSPRSIPTALSRLAIWRTTYTENTGGERKAAHSPSSSIPGSDTGQSKCDHHHVGSMRFAHSNRGGATGAWPGNADTVSEEGSRFLFHVLHTFRRQCQSHEIGSRPPPPPLNRWIFSSEIIHKKFSTFFQKRGEGFLKECAKKWLFCSEIK